MRTRFWSLALTTAVALSVLLAAPASAGSPVHHDSGSAKKEVSRVYFDDDICGPRANWTEFVVTWHWAYTERPNGSFNFMYIETGTYHSDFDDPTIPSVDGRFTGAEHATATAGDTFVHTVQWHDFLDGITIHEQLLFVQVGDEIRLDRHLIRVDGCP
jgi:hypothetical protein